jgi:hypothetical protein
MDSIAEIMEHIKTLPSDAAATLLMKIFPIESLNYSDAFQVLAHRSWSRADQIRLACFYLQKMPFASPRPYEVFASFMDLPRLITIVKERLPANSNDRRLVAYHVMPVLTKNIKSQHDRRALDILCDELSPTRLAP